MSIICLCINRFPWNLHQCFLFEKIFHGRCTIIQCCLFLQYVTRNFSDRTWVCLQNYNAYKRVQKHHRPFYTPPHKKWRGIMLYPPNFECPSVRPSVCLSVSASFPCSNFSTFWPIFFKFCIDIGIGEEWFWIAVGLISFRKNSFGPWCMSEMLWARWLSGRVSDSGARGRGFDTYRRRVVSLSKTLYSPKVLVNYPGSDGSVPIWLKNCWLGR